jgi:hypothetical protein
MHKCAYCKKTFKYDSLLIRHQNSKKKCTDPKKEYKCNVCNITCERPAELERHLATKRCQEKHAKIPIIPSIKIKKVYSINELLKLKDRAAPVDFIYQNEIQSKTYELNSDLSPIYEKVTNYKNLHKLDMNYIVSKFNKLLTLYDLIYVINYDLNKIYIDKFLYTIESSEYISVDDELITMLGYDEIDIGRIILLNIIKSSDKHDYNVLDDNSQILISIDCFKRICIKLDSVESENLLTNFIKIEKIIAFYTRYTSEFNMYELEKIKLIKNQYINKNEIQLNSKLYLTTTPAKAKENIFKFGSTINEKARLCSYNTGHVEADKFIFAAVYECYDAISLEKRIAKLLINFKIPNESEMYQLHFTALNKLIQTACDNDIKSMDYINDFLNNEYNDYLKSEPIEFF